MRVHYRLSISVAVDCECEVYEINSVPALWRPVKDCGQEKALGWVRKEDTSVFTHRHVHWLARRKLANVDNETFETISLPPFDLEKNYQDKHYLTELGGRLCLFHTDVANNFCPQRYDIWLLHSHSTSVWDLHCRIELSTLPRNVANFMHFVYWIGLLSAIDNGRRIIIRLCKVSLEKPSFKLCAYAPVIGDTESLLNGSGLVSIDSIKSQHAALYEESIASPGRPLTTFKCADCVLALLR